MRAKAREARGQGTAAAQIRMALREQDGGTAASIVTEMQMSGKAAAMGQGVIRDVAAVAHRHLREEPRRLVTAGEPARARGRAAARARGAGRAGGAPPAAPARPAAPPRAAAAPPEPRPPTRRRPAGGSSCRRSSPGACRTRGPARSVAGLLALLLLRVGIAIGRRR